MLRQPMLASQFERPAIEELMRELCRDYSIIIVTHNMQQAARLSNYTAFLMTEKDRMGELIGYGESPANIYQPQRRAN